jgi:hypothetical protein
MAAGPDSAYPVSFGVERSPSQSRLLNFPFFGAIIKGILLIPHLIILYFLGIVANILYLIATFAILFTGRFPEGMFNFIAGTLRWNIAVYAYLGHLTDRYPGFSMSTEAQPAIQFEVAYPATSNRILNFPFFGLIIKAILLIPHLIIVYFLYLAALIVTFIATFAILFTGSYPEGMHRFVAGVGRWAIRIYAYEYALTDVYPPFSTS